MSFLGGADDSDFSKGGQGETSAGKSRNLFNKNRDELIGLTGSATRNLTADANSLEIKNPEHEGSFESRQNELISLINSFNDRQKEVRERLQEPGNSQTRLSMVR